MQIAVVTDGTCDLPSELAAERGVEIVPHHVIWGGETYTDGVNITSDIFYDRLARDPELPKTSQPSPGDFADAYHRVQRKHNADAVLCITTSDRITGAHGSAVVARDLVDFPVEVVDSRMATIPLGLIVLATAEACQRGMTLEQAVQFVHESSEHSHFFFTLGTLEFLYRGGRIGGARHLIGTALNIKPVLHIKDGVVEPYENVRTRKRALARLVDIANGYQDKHPLRLGVVHSRAAEVNDFSQELQDLLKPDQFFVTLACSPVGVYAGPGSIGFGLLYGA